MITGLAGRHEIRSAESCLTSNHNQVPRIFPSKTTTTTMSKPSAQIPVIDISPSNPHAATQLLDAAANNGFVFIENNAAAAMPPANIENMFNLVTIYHLSTRTGY